MKSRERIQAALAPPPENIIPMHRQERGMVRGPKEGGVPYPFTDYAPCWSYEGEQWIEDGGYSPSCDPAVPPDVSWDNCVHYVKLLAHKTGWL